VPRRALRYLLAVLAVAGPMFAFGIGPTAAAGKVCYFDPAMGRIVCTASGVIPGDPPPGPGGGGGGGTAPPLRYLRTTVRADLGRCWLWARRPPGLDSWDPANDAAIIHTRFLFPECPGATDTGETVDDVASLAWEIFREFPLGEPDPVLQPAIGITGLASFVAVTPPAPIEHSEGLPDGSALEVRAEVAAVGVDWGDGSSEGFFPDEVTGHPEGAAHHVFRTKTCSPGYRAGHPAGRNCHPTLEAYPVAVTFSWWGSYRVGGVWIDLGALDLIAVVGYDVDEVLGVLEP